MATPRTAGILLFMGGLEMLFLVHLAEFLYPGYSVSQNYISDLGVGPSLSRWIFTAGIIVFGAIALEAALLFRQRLRRSLLWPFLGLTGVGAIGVGVFNEDITLLHSAFAFVAFLFGNLTVIVSSRMVRRPLSWLFLGLGLLGLSALALFGADAYLGLGAGGMERMIFYPAMFWALGFGAYVMAWETPSRPA